MKTARPLCRVSALLGIVFVGACASDAGTSPRGATVRDSAGIAILEYEGALPDRPGTLEVVWTHGFEPDDYTFQFALMGVLRPDGSAVIADIGNQEVVRIAGEGDSYDLLAATGQGPGEVAFPGAIVRAGDDGVWVGDRRNAKLMFYAGDSLVNVVSTQGDRTLSMGFSPVSATDDGRLLMTTGSYMTDFEEEWLDGHLARFDPDTRALDTLGTYPLAPRRPEEGANPFQATGHVVGAGEGFVHSRSDIPEVIWRDGDGAVTRIVRWQPDLAYPTDDLWATFEEMLRTDLALMNPTLGEDELHRFVERQVASFTVDESMPLPLFQQLRGGSEGAVWLADFVPGNGWPVSYTVVSADETTSGHVAFPGPFLVVDVIDDLVLGVMKDDFDVQGVVLYRYHFPEGESPR